MVAGKIMDRRVSRRVPIGSEVDTCENRNRQISYGNTIDRPRTPMIDHWRGKNSRKVKNGDRFSCSHLSDCDLVTNATAGEA